MRKLFNLFHRRAINKINSMFGWELPSCAMGAFAADYDDGKLLIYVETSDGSVSTVEYRKLLKNAVNGRISQEDFCKCFH